MRKSKILFISLTIFSASFYCESALAQNEIDCPFTAETGATCWQCGDDCTAKFYNGKMTISGTGDMYDYANKADSPWYSLRNSITSVEIKDGIERVGSRAFSDSNNLTELSLSHSLESVGQDAFVRAAISDINIPASVQEIEAGAFGNCCNRPLVPTNLTFEEGSNLTLIATSAFRDLGLTQVVLPDSENLTMEADVFAGTSITDIIVPAGIANGSRAFQSIQTALKVYCTQDLKDAGKCNSSYLGKSPMTVTLYERDENGNFIVYNNDGTIKGVYGNGNNVFSDTVVDFYETTDEETGMVTRYDGRGQFLSSILQDAAGSIYKYDKDGNLKGMTKRGPMTIPEADALTRKGSVNTLSFTW